MCTSLQRPVQCLSGYFCITGKNRKGKKLNEKTPKTRYTYLQRYVFIYRCQVQIDNYSKPNITAQKTL